MKRLFLALCAMLLIAALAVLALLWWSAGPKPGPHTIIVEEGSTLSSVADELDRRGIIPGNPTTFRAMARIFGSDDPIQAGEFEIPKGTGAAGVLDLLQHGKPVQRLVTVTEGMPSIIVEEKLAANRYLTGPVPDIPEGSVLPDSYSYQRDETRAAVVARMQEAMTRALTTLWAKRKPTCPIDSKLEAVTLASIVEKETAKASERRMVAGVYCNRLRIGMKLDADPTVIYPITKGKPLGRRIRKSELQSDNPYNTYANPGLPPGPIANPGRESIAAVLDPAATGALYFVADGTGGHAFAETLEEQQANVRRWYELRRKRGEM
ncbi:MAG TPA: endolytic transglycosylase MltG [Sphingomicrobium sp.]|nr:endolytic transglycosylase MltG [Sphingomicrobium sp.]